MSTVNVIHIGDIFYPPNDPDDVLDVEALVGLHCAGKINLQNIILDRPDIQAQKPGKLVIDKVNAAAGTNIPYGIGYHALLDALRSASGQVVITTAGSLEDLYWAYKTDPVLCQQKIKEAWIFAGDAQLNPPRGHRDGRDVFHLGLEYNVAMDHVAFREVMKSNLDIVWIPCYDGGLVINYSDGVNMKNGSYWMSQYELLFSKSLPQTRDTYIWALSGERGDGKLYSWNEIKGHHKELFGVGIFRAMVEPNLNYPFRFVDERITVNDNATVARGSGKQVKLFERTDNANYYQRMTEISADVLGMMGRAAPIPEPEPPGEDDIEMEIKKPVFIWSSPLVPITNSIEKLIQHHMAHTTWTVFDVHNYHRDTNGWKGIGYNYWIAFDGTIYECRGRNVGAHAGANWNSRSLGIGYQGNFEIQQMTEAQLKSGTWLNAKFIQEEGLTVEDIIGHKDVTSTLCPGKNFRMEELKQEAAKILGGEAVGTPIIGEAQAAVEQAKAWALKRGAHQRFIDIAPVYWAYGEQTGIRPEILYAQSAKETAFGKYTGVIPPSHNNWAGIKTREATGDRPEDHQQFPTPEDGVRGHFNHISAYVGLEPVGEPHGRYYLVKGLSWAGTVKTVEELGEKWAPSSDYGHSIIRDYLKDLLATEIPAPVDPPDDPDECSSCNALKAENQQLKNDLISVSEELNQVEKRKNELQVAINQVAGILNNLN
ncbi:MAG: N-acetylmuramoyl-L-alanine amidase [Candidatus Contubernalis sp.]|nr:N-acetylmuramoyl-L-alanine amidase [Candidatus Contubernalis sp.]